SASTPSSRIESPRTILIGLNENNTQTTGSRRIPDTDLAGALESLAPQAWVSTTAIQLVLSIIRPAYCRFIDTAFIPVHNLEALQHKHLLRLQDETRIWLPIKHRDHYSLAIIDLTNRVITVHDSLTRPQYETEAREIVQAIIRFLNRHDRYRDASWTQVQMHDHQQQNDFDCGLYVMIFAFCDISAHAFPTQVHSLRWRHLFRRFLQPREGDLVTHVIAVDEANLATLLTRDVRLQDVDAIHQVHQECFQLLTVAQENLQSTQDCRDIYQAASQVVYSEQTRIHEKLVGQGQHCESEIALLQVLLDTLRNSDTKLPDPTVEQAIEQGNAATASRLALSKERLTTTTAKLDGWNAAGETCRKAYQKALESNDHGAENFRKCMDLLQKAKRVQEQALAVTEKFIDSARALFPNSKNQK
ncbi:MAG: hypothetical protein Q9210_007510, partial [Variospora velana]